MGNYESHYYNTINSNNQTKSTDDEIIKMENMFRFHLHEYVSEPSTYPNKKIKKVVTLDDFYDLLNDSYYKSYMQVYERKLFGLTHLEASENYVKSNRDVDQNLFDIINSELIMTIKKYDEVILFAESHFYTACELTEKIEEYIYDIKNLEGDELYYATEQLTQMIGAKRNIVSELTQSGIVIVDEEDLISQVDKLEHIIKKCLMIIKRTRHALKKISDNDNNGEKLLTDNE